MGRRVFRHFTHRVIDPEFFRFSGDRVQSGGEGDFGTIAGKLKSRRPRGKAMNFGGYRLQAQNGVGRDGVSFRALTPDGSTAVEVRDLTPARSVPDRWPRLTHRLQLAARLYRSVLFPSGG